MLISTLGTLAGSLGYCRKTSSAFGNANSFGASSFDSTTKSLFFGTTSNSPPLVLKLNSLTFPSSVSLNFSFNGEGLFVSVNDPTTGIVYFAGGSGIDTGTITRVFATNWTELDTMTLGDQVWSGVIDTTNGFIYFGTYGGSILKMRTSDFTIVAQIDNLSGILNCGIIDTTGKILFPPTLFLLPYFALQDTTPLSLEMSQSVICDFFSKYYTNVYFIYSCHT
jgi:hypothetical protein